MSQVDNNRGEYDITQQTLVDNSVKDTMQKFMEGNDNVIYNFTPELEVDEAGQDVEVFHAEAVDALDAWFYIYGDGSWGTKLK